MIDKLSNLKNKELQEILNYIQSEPIFFGDNMRLLSKDEILNYKEELGIDINNILPIIDLNDNNFLVYNLEKNTFEKLNIEDETFFGETDSISNYLELLGKHEY